jgi:acetyl-CoA acyltransferase
MILASVDGLARLGITPEDCVELVGYGLATSPLGQVDDLTRLGNTAKAISELYDDTGIRADDVEVAEVHDCFHVTEALMTEALGFAPPGQGAALAVDGATSLDGSIPINTGGGLIAFGHPVGATGVKQVLEVTRQMKGECGEYQMPTAPRVGVTANMGGDDRTSVCMALRC